MQLLYPFPTLRTPPECLWSQVVEVVHLAHFWVDTKVAVFSGKADEHNTFLEMKVKQQEDARNKKKDNSKKNK